MLTTDQVLPPSLERSSEIGTPSMNLTRSSSKTFDDATIRRSDASPGLAERTRATITFDANLSQRLVAELRRNHSKSLEMPSWLWSSVVELVGQHERAYLDHCRRYAMAEPA